MSPPPDKEQFLDLITRLSACCDLWSAANDASRAWLGKKVTNDGSFFTRIGSGSSLTTATLEKFASFFADPANWKTGQIPQEVEAFIVIVAPKHAANPPSPDNASQNIGGENIGGAGVAVLSSPGGEAPGRASVVLRPAQDQTDHGLREAADVVRRAEDERVVAAGEAAVIGEAA